MIRNLAKQIEKDIGQNKDKSVWLRVPGSWVELDCNPDELVKR